MSFCFVHTADLHLDAPLKALALRDPDLATKVGTASRQAFARIVDLCVEAEAAFLLISGDLWDGAATTKTPRFLKQELMRLRDHGIRCYLIRGNHDATTKNTGELDLPDNSFLFGHRASTQLFSVHDHQIAIHGLSFRDSQAPDNLLPLYPAAVAGAFNIGMMHTSLNGSQRHDPYAPCSVAELDSHGYNYWALGHIHRRAQHHGKATIVMPGIPQGRDIGEADDRSVTLVRVGDDHSVQLEQHSVATVRFEQKFIDCGGIDDWSELMHGIERQINAAARADRVEDTLIIRAVLTGQTPLAWRIARDYDQLKSEIGAFAGHVGIWIDKIVLSLDTKTGAAEAAYAQLPNELVDTVLSDLMLDQGLLSQIEAKAQALLNELPPGLRNDFGKDEAEFRAICAALLAEGAPLILTQLNLDEGK